jgi:hypothetical protein
VRPAWVGLPPECEVLIPSYALSFWSDLHIVRLMLGPFITIWNYFFSYLAIHPILQSSFLIQCLCFPIFYKHEDQIDDTFQNIGSIIFYYNNSSIGWITDFL